MDYAEIRAIEIEYVRVREMAAVAISKPENIDAVAAIMVVKNLMDRARNQNGALVPVRQESIGEIPETFGEWASHYRLDSHTDRFLAIAVYLLDKERISDLNANLFMEMYSKARWVKPKNPADVLGKAANKSLFTESDTQPEEGARNWRLTRTGKIQFDRLANQGE